MPDDGKGVKTIWRVENMDLVQVWIKGTNQRGSQRDVVYLSWPIGPLYVSPNAGERGGDLVSDNEYSYSHGALLWQTAESLIGIVHRKRIYKSIGLFTVKSISSSVLTLFYTGGDKKLSVWGATVLCYSPSGCPNSPFNLTLFYIGGDG